jgi:anti-sigma factor RsiW
MNCSLDLIEAYMDNELDASERARVEQHLAGCPDCTDALARLESQKAQIRASATYFRAPEDLRAAIASSARKASIEPISAQPRRPSPWWRPLAIAAGVLLVASSSWNIVQLVSRTSQDPVQQELVSDHIRSLIGTHLMDVPSSDQHTVKPWFAGRLDFSPDVRDLAAQGFPLAGGRVEYLTGRRVAALVYHRRLHVINLFIWPGATSAVESHAARDGFNLLRWSDGVMTYWAVSDVAATELQTFRDLYR